MIDPAAACLKAAELQELHDKYKSWRQVQLLHYPKVPAGTLCRIAKSDGKYLPKGRRELRALGLLEPRRKRTEIEKRIAEMARNTRKALTLAHPGAVRQDRCARSACEVRG